jgi:hypothetical protein
MVVRAMAVQTPALTSGISDRDFWQVIVELSDLAAGIPCLKFKDGSHAVNPQQGLKSCSNLEVTERCGYLKGK